MQPWYKQLGFSKYPLDPRSNTDLVGVAEIEEKVTEFITQGNMCLLCGFTGSGKTSMLMRIMKSDKLKEFQFVFISADGVKKDYDISDAIKDGQSFIDMFTFKKPKNIVVLLDESHLANRILTESIKSKWNYQYSDGKKMIQAVVVSQIEPQLGTNFSGSFMDRLGQRIVQMKRLNHDELSQVIKRRLSTGSKDYYEYFSEDGLQFLTKSADGSVRQLLEYTDALFRRLCSMEKNPFADRTFKIDQSVMFNILQESGLAVDEKVVLARKGQFQRVMENKRLRNVLEIFESAGSLSAELLAEKLDVTKRTSLELLNELEQADCVIYSHTDNDQRYYVMTPRVKHMMVKQ